MNKFFKYAVCSILIVLINGCAVGNKHKYDHVDLDLQPLNILNIAVATFDQRSYILSGNKQPHFVGIQRAGFGNPYSVTTASGNPLATDITMTIVESMQQQGIQAAPVIVDSQNNLQSVISKLVRKGADRSLLLILQEWKSDTYKSTGLAYNLKVQVLDANGEVKVAKEFQGKEHLGGSFWNPPGHAKSSVPKFFKKKLEMLLNNQEILTAIRVGESNP